MKLLKTQIEQTPAYQAVSLCPKLSKFGSQLIILACLGSQSAQADECVKQVFNHYCLGGDITAFLATQDTPPEAISLENGDTRYLTQSNQKTVVLTSHEKTITEVTRHETPGDWINYTAWKVKLVRLYGRGEDLSNFPRYATSRSSRLNAINAGRGHAEFLWDQQDHIIKLIWDEPDYIKLSYQLSDSLNGEPENTEGL